MRVLRAQHDGDRAGLGAAVDLGHRDAAVVEGLDQRLGHHLRAAVDELQRRQVGRRPIGVLDHRPHHRRHQQAGARPPGGHVVQPGGRVETCLQLHAAAGGQRRQHLDAQAADMEHRQHRQHARGGVETLGVDGRGDVGLHAGHGVDGALGLAGGARGVDQHQVAGFVPGCPRLRQRRQGQHLGRQRRVGVVVQQLLQAGVLHDEGQLGRRQAPVQRHPARAQAAAGRQQRQRAQAVVGQPADAVAGADAERAQRGFFSVRGAFDVGGVELVTHATISSSRSPGSYRHSRPRRSWQSSAVHGSIRLPQRLSR